jgi:hypothetical protein
LNINKTFIEETFSKKIKMAEKFNMADILEKIQNFLCNNRRMSMKYSQFLICNTPYDYIKIKLMFSNGG